MIQKLNYEVIPKQFEFFKAGENFKFEKTVIPLDLDKKDKNLLIIYNLKSVWHEWMKKNKIRIHIDIVNLLFDH